MSIRRRRFLALVAGAGTLLGASHASTQTYPARPVRLVVGFAAGGGTDIVARMIADWLSQYLGQQFVVENRTGMSGHLATEAVLRSPPDGYTLLFTGSNSTIGTSLYKKLLFDFRRDSTPVGFVLRFPNLMVIPLSLPAESVSEFINYGKMNPGKLSLASSGIGTTLHLSGEMFSLMTGIKMTHVPYRGSAAAYPDLISGRVHVLFDNITSALEMARSGKVRILGVTSAVRWEPLPHIPAIAETVDGFETMVWYGIVAPAGTPSDIVVTLNSAVNAALSNLEFSARLAGTGGLPVHMTPEEFRKFIDDDTEKWRAVVNFSGVSVE